MFITEQQRLDAIALCDRITATAKRLDEDFAKLKEAADAWKRDLDAAKAGSAKSC